MLSPFAHPVARHGTSSLPQILAAAIVAAGSLAACRQPASPMRCESGDAAAPECPPPPPPVTIPGECPSDRTALTTTGEDQLTLVRVGFGKLPGWSDDHHAAALPPLLASCAKLAELPDHAPIGSGPYGGRAGDWRHACTAAAEVPAGDDTAARKFFEREFTAYAARGRDGFVGKMTGYYVQPLDGARQRGGAYQFPIYSRPPDLVETQLSDFIDDGRSRRIWGRLDPDDPGQMIPYPTRGEIAEELDRDRALFWLDDPLDVLLVEIEGSGKVTLPDGSQVWVNFSGKNGRSSHGFRTLIRSLKELAASPAGTATDRAAVAAYRARAREIIDLKDSIVFFEVVPQAAAIGTQDVALTPLRSIAVDRAVIPLSTPVWISTRAKPTADQPVGPWNHLLIAQDTGGHILGTVRADIYFGADDDAIAMGGHVNTPGRMWLLFPTGVKPPPR